MKMLNDILKRHVSSQSQSVKENIPPPKKQKKSSNQIFSKPASKKKAVKILFIYNEGYSNAVRKPLLVKELKF